MKKKILIMFMALIMALGLAACGGSETAEPTTAPEPTKTETAKEPTKAPTPEPTKAPVTVTDRTVYDMSDWEFYLGVIEHAGNFNGGSLVFARSKDLSKAGFVVLGADGISGGYFFGLTSLDESTGIYSITEEATGEVAYFKMQMEWDNYVLDLGGLGMMTTLKWEENIGQMYVDIVKNAATNTTSEFLTELAKVKEGRVEDGYFYGVMDTGELVYYARTQNSTYNGLLITSADKKDVVAVWGTAYFDVTAQMEFIEDSTGYLVFYQVTPVSGGYELKFANGALGTVTVTRCEEYEFLDAMDYAYSKSENNRLEEFVDGLNQ